MARPHDERREQWSGHDLPSALSIRMASVLAMRANDETGRRLYESYFESYDGDDPIALQFAQAGSLDLSRFGSDAWSPNLDVISRCYRAGLTFDHHTFYSRHNREYKSMQIDLARTIIDRAEKLPGTLVRFAEDRCRKDVAAKIVPVVRVAERELWFGS